LETSGRLPDFGIGVIELSLRNFGKAPSGPTDQLPFRWDNSLDILKRKIYFVE